MIFTYLANNEVNIVCIAKIFVILGKVNIQGQFIVKSWKIPWIFGRYNNKMLYFFNPLSSQFLWYKWMLIFILVTLSHNWSSDTFNDKGGAKSKIKENMSTELTKEYRHFHCNLVIDELFWTFQQLLGANSDWQHPFFTNIILISIKWFLLKSICHMLKQL